MAKRSTIKTLFLDIDQVLTTSGKPEERRIVPEAIQSLRRAVDHLGYKRLVFITARAQPWVAANVIPAVREAGLLVQSEFHGENGLYEIHPEGHITHTPEAEKFLKARQHLTLAVEAALRERGVPFENASAKTGKLVQVRFVPKEGANLASFNSAIVETVSHLQSQGAVPHDVRVVATKSGANIGPHSVDKGTTARRVIYRMEKQSGAATRVRGKAFGDDPKEDRLMAWGKKVKWIPVEDVRGFLRKMESLQARRIKK